MSNEVKLDQMLEKELAAVRRTCDRLGDGGRARLAEYLGIRPSEVSRYLSATTRKPSGPILAGMRQFVKKHAKATKAKAA